METHDESSLADLAILAGVVLASATLLAWSRQYCSMHNADSLLFAIISVTKITPYYWGQNRLGNVLPFVTAWITDIQVNMMAQVFLRALSASALPLLLTAIIRPKAPLLASFGVALALLLVNFNVDHVFVFWIEGSPYATSGVVLAAAVYLVEVRRAWWVWLAVFTLLVLALFMNLALIVFAGPLFALLAVLMRSRRYAVATLLIATAYLLLAWHAAYVGGRDYTQFEWGWHHLSIAWQRISGMRFGIQTYLGGVLAILAICIWHRRVTETALRTVAVVIATGVAIVITANATWPVNNGLHIRYFAPYAAILVATCGVLIVEAVSLGVSWRRTLAIVGAVLGLSASAAAAWPVTSKCPRYYPDGVPQAVERLSPAARQFGVVLVAGDFWRSWTLVYDLLRQRKEAYGITLRGQAIRDHVRRAVEESNDVGLVCFETARVCAVMYTQTTGLETFHGKPIADAMVKLSDGILPDGKPYSVFRLK